MYIARLDKIYTDIHMSSKEEDCKILPYNIYGVYQKVTRSSNSVLILHLIFFCLKRIAKLCWQVTFLLFEKHKIIWNKVSRLSRIKWRIITKCVLFLHNKVKMYEWYKQDRMATFLPELLNFD